MRVWRSHLFSCLTSTDPSHGLTANLGARIISWCPVPSGAQSYWPSEELCAQADVIITIASAFEPLLEHSWIKPGTHLACMGTDTKGKQEVAADLVANATLFTDEIAQSVSIGETQHAIAAGSISEDSITSIGDVINGTHPGRSSADEITLFDGTGVGLQDLAVASVAAKLAEAQGKAQIVEL